MTQLLISLILIPLTGLVSCMLLPKRWERAIFSTAMTAVVAELSVYTALLYQWLNSGTSAVLASAGTLFRSEHYTFSLDFFFDRTSAVFMAMATIMVGLVFIFSKYYMHREQGFKRFYYTTLLFFTGISLITLAGNFEVLLLGWELIGISSVLLIAFYRDRYLPARNALKVFSVYRIADAFLLTAVWYAHHIFESNVHFADFAELALQHSEQVALLGLFLLAAALIKSAQFPFSYWLPRAMEGPTSSSAIFYGALSVHMGLFLLLRTYPLWQDSDWLRIVIAAVGLVTAVVAASITRVQSSIKTQIAYASITQIGIMFIEVALGLPWLVLIHFVSNASLRTYQLLISPSVVSYLVHDQFFHFVPPAQRMSKSLVGRLRATLYVLSIKEWNMSTTERNYFWRRLKAIGRSFAFLDKPAVQIASIGLFGIIAITAAIADVALVVSNVAALLGIIFYIRAYATKAAAKTCWNLLALGHMFSALFLSAASAQGWSYLALYSVGVAVAFVAGHMCLHYLESHGQSTKLKTYHGAMYKFKKLGHVFFFVCLFYMAFPISPSFLAQDILLSLIPRDNALQILLFCLSYLLVGVSVMRVYVKVFFGYHTSSFHERAYKSS